MQTNDNNSVIENGCGNQNLITKREVAVRLRKTTRTIDAWMAAGILPYFKIGRSVLFDWNDCQRHLAECFRVSRFKCNVKAKGSYRE